MPVKIGVLLAFYLTATLICACLLVILLRSGAFAAIDVLFYRGVAALAMSGSLLIAILWILVRRLPEGLSLSARDAAGAAAVSFSLLLAAFVLGPVTVDRSVSIFILSQFDRAGVPLTQQAARNAFVRNYVDDWDQIGRRLREQEISGNLERTPQGWQLTSQGRVFMETARVISHLFGGDPRFVGAHITPSDPGIALNACNP